MPPVLSDTYKCFVFSFGKNKSKSKKKVKAIPVTGCGGL
jgi:hypothetical protein